MDDQEIIALFYARSERAIAELSAKYGGVCTQISRNILSNPLDAVECVNDAYLGVWNTIPPQRPDPLLTYVCRIMRNLSIKKYHANTAVKRNSSYDAALEELAACVPAAATVEGEYAAKELAAALDRFLATLDREGRVMFVRRYWYADSPTDIGARFRCSGHTVSVRLSRIREKLRKFLEKEGFTV